MRTPKRAPSGAVALRTTLSVVAKVPSAAMATAPAAAPPILATSPSDTAHRVYSVLRPAEVQASPA
ncbi:hypothetical protein IC744_10260 [Microbacterium hominis]|uniref:hypothetical protein n=1 Tax=Microbacterium hominis TaxID=162426 RepID=UPI00168B4460|nr:hypothetical protein [Microbacterium hominis]QOC27854.1 hypothetical protein IC744_10260 [Microbacterium hominis]